MISPDQLKLYWAELRAVLALRKDLTREEFHRLHNLPASTKDFTRAHFDTFLAACKAITQPANLKPQLRALNQDKTRLLHKILVEQAAMLNALEKPGLDTILHICRDKFHGRKPADLSANKRPPLNDGDEPRPSELEMLLFTVARTVSELRQARGWTVHELLWQSGLGQTCACKDCRRPTGVVINKPRRNRREEILTNEPF